MILTVTPNPCVDKTIFCDRVELGTIIRGQKASAVAGGKGSNVSRVVKTLGRPTKAFQIVGGHTGAHIEEMISIEDGVETVPVWVSAPSREIVTVLDTGKHVQTAYMEPGPELTPEEVKKVHEVFNQVVGEAKVVTFNGAVSCSALDTLYYDLIPICAEGGARTVLDSHGPAFSEGIKAKPYMVKPNIEEAQELFGETIRSDADILGAIARYRDLGIRLVVISMGARGAFASLDGRALKCTSPKIKEVNPVGSGDALVAGFAVGLMEGMDLEEMCKLGAGAGTANAASWDIGHCSREEIQRYAEEVSVETL
jgi:1-phosphofructokinase family hexose kinase